MPKAVRAEQASGARASRRHAPDGSTGSPAYCSSPKSRSLLSSTALDVLDRIFAAGLERSTIETGHKGGKEMPKIKVNDITMNYEQEGTGEPLVLIPYLAADNACYAFQVADYAKHFTCISVDLRGSGVSDKPAGTYTTELYSDDVAGLMEAIGVERAHVMGLSLGASTGMWLAAKYPARVKSLSLHSAWPKTDLFVTTVVRSW